MVSGHDIQFPGMKSVLSFITCSWLIVFSVGPAPAERINPAGISGALVLSGQNLSDGAIDKFNELAGGMEMRLVLLALDSGKFVEGLAARIRHRCKEKDLPAPLLAVSGPGQETGKTLAAINSATGVWLLGQDSSAIRDRLASPGLQASVSALMTRGGVVGACGATCPVLATDGIGLFPGSVIFADKGAGEADLRRDKVLRERPFLVGYEIDGSAALVVRGRRVMVAGKGEVEISLAAAAGRKARLIVLKGPEAVADLSARIWWMHCTQTAIPCAFSMTCRRENVKTCPR